MNNQIYLDCLKFLQHSFPSKSATGVWIVVNQEGNDQTGKSCFYLNQSHAITWLSL